VNEEYQCRDCGYLLRKFPAKERKQLRCACQNCGVEYHFILNEGTGRYIFQNEPATEPIPKIVAAAMASAEPVAEPVKRGPGRPKKVASDAS